METNNRCAHILKQQNIENFYKYMSGEKEIITNKDNEEFEASYFAMCLLLPKKAFLEVVNVFGGLEKVKKDFTTKQAIARLFFVEPKLVSIRIDDLLSRQNENSKKDGKVLKNIPKEQI